MSIFNRAEMFNRRANSSKSKSSEIIKSLRIERGNVIADIGSGGGYYTMRFAAETGLDGKVYAVDINKEFLDHINSKAENNGLTNIQTIQINESVKGLPIGGCDLLFFRNVYHHIPNPEGYFKEIKKFLKPSGRIAIIDYKKTDRFSFTKLTGHFVEEEYIIISLIKAGFRHVHSFDYLSNQSFNIFQI